MAAATSSNRRLPEELWRRILEVGVMESSSLNYKDLCCVSITCRLLNRLSNEDPLWVHLHSFDFPSSSSSSSSTQQQQNPNASSKSIYEFRFEKDRARKLLAHRRAVLRIESQVSDHLRKLREIELQLAEETKKMKATLTELSNLHKVRQASVALNVWQPEVVRARQKQIVQNCSVSVDSRINAVEMELKLCKQQIAGFDKACRDEKQRLEASKERLASINYQPLKSLKPPSSSLDEGRIKRKKFKTCIN